MGKSGRKFLVKIKFTWRKVGQKGTEKAKEGHREDTAGSVLLISVKG